MSHNKANFVEISADLFTMACHIIVINCYINKVHAISKHPNDLIDSIYFFFSFMMKNYIF
jgi:hypothetical protein